MNSPKIVAIILARLSSSRLPEKHLRKIAGRPLIYHVVQRLKTVGEIDEIVLATTSQNENRSLGAFAGEQGISVRYDEDEDDVTGRVYRTAAEYAADIIVTISGDCPLIDPRFIRDEIHAVLETGADYAGPKTATGRCLHEGISTHTYRAYQRIAEMSRTWFYKEHPASVVRDYPGRFKKAEVSIPKMFEENIFRISVDCMSDLHFMNRVYSELYREDSVVDLGEVVRLVKRKPGLLSINKHVHQKAVREKPAKALYLTQASPALGFGHLSRIMSLARELSESASIAPILAMPFDERASQMARERGFRTYDSGSHLHGEKLDELMALYKPEICFIDMKGPLPDGVIRFLRSKPCPIVSIDAQPDSFEPDLTVIPALDRPDAPPLIRENTYRGKEWIILDRMVQYYKTVRASTGEVVIAGGGSIHLCEKYWPLFRELSLQHSLTFMIGPYISQTAFRRQLMSYKIENFSIVQNPTDPLSIYSRSKAVLAIFGVTVFETVAMGVPTVVMDARTEQDKSIVKELARLGAVLDRVSEDPDSHLAANGGLCTLLNDPDFLNRLSRRGTNAIDGLGIERILDKALSLIERTDAR